MDHTRALRFIISGLPRDWKRPPRRPRRTWLRTIEQDLAAAQHWLGVGNGLRIVNRGTGYSPGWHMLLMMMMMMTLCVGDNKNWHNTLAVTVLEMVILSFLSSILVICDEIYIGSF